MVGEIPVDSEYESPQDSLSTAATLKQLLFLLNCVYWLVPEYELADVENETTEFLSYYCWKGMGKQSC